MSQPQFPTGLSELIAPFAAVISDVWGVVYNGTRGEPEANEALSRARASGRPVVLLSNAPKPSPVVANGLIKRGVAADAFDAIITSGDICRREARALGAHRRMYHLGPSVDHATVGDLPHPRAERAEEADFILCTGLAEEEQLPVPDHADLLAKAAQRSVPMLCANPDVVVERMGEMVPCAGAVAAVYEEIGGPVTRLGKPEAIAYEACFARFGELGHGEIHPDRVLAIGDALATDIAGAARFGLKALFIGDGIHRPDLPHETETPEAWQAAVAGLMNGHRHTPLAAMRRLSW